MSGVRRRISVLLGVVLVTLALVPSAAFAATSAKPSVTVPSSILVTIDGQRLWSRRPDTRRRVASTIKMLNALVVRERTKLDDVVTVSAKAARTEDGVGLVRGQRLTVRQLLKLMLVASSNDAAEALAIHIAGSERAYVRLMNAKAKSLGLTNTHAVDPHGLSKRERSTSRDLSRLARKFMADPVLRKIVLLRSVKLPRPGHAPRILPATDRLLGHYRGIEGVKTGFTNPAGYCFVGAAKRGNLELVGVVLGASSVSSRFTQMRRLLNWGFARYRMRRLVSCDTTYGAVQISYGTTASVTVHAACDESRAVLATGCVISRQIILPATVSAPIKRGDQLGVVRVTQDGRSLVSAALLADSDVASVTPPPKPELAVDPREEVNAAPRGWARATAMLQEVLRLVQL